MSKLMLTLSINTGGKFQFLNSDKYSKQVFRNAVDVEELVSRLRYSPVYINIIMDYYLPSTVSVGALAKFFKVPCAMEVLIVCT